MPVWEAHCVHHHVFSLNVRLAWFVWLWLFSFPVFYSKIRPKSMKAILTIESCHTKGVFFYVSILLWILMISKRSLEGGNGCTGNKTRMALRKQRNPEQLNKESFWDWAYQPCPPLETCHLMWNWSHMESKKALLNAPPPVIISWNWRGGKPWCCWRDSCI